jgi:transcription elongation GreA/GreB family factor
MKPTKADVLKGFIEKLKDERNALVASAKAAHLAATHEESKAEDRHDTFAIENSYLAAGQAARVAEIEQTLVEFEHYANQSAPHVQVGPGSYICYDCDGLKCFALITVLGGGSKLEMDGKSIQVISLKSPLGEELESARPGEEITLELRGIEKDYRLLELT